MTDNQGPQGWQPQNPQQPQQPQGWPQAPQQGWQRGPAQPAAPQGWPQGQQPAPGAPAGWQQQAPGQGWPADQNAQQFPQNAEQQWQGAPAGWQPGAEQAAPKKRTPLVLTALTVVLALVAGFAVWFFAIRDTKGEGGAAAPQDAVNTMLVSLAKKDAIGVADQLDPSEAALFTDITGDILAELKRLQIIREDFNPESISGTTITVEGLTFDTAAEETINDHLHIVKLTGGTVTLTSDPSTVPFTDKIKDALGEELANAKPTTETVKIEDQVAKSGGPIRIATVLRDGKWYPSMFYTAADMWLQDAKKNNPALTNPTAADAIAAQGAASPEAAVDALLAKATEGDIEGVVGMLPPDEMGVLYDYGRLMMAEAHIEAKTELPGDVKITDTEWAVSDASGGKKVSIKKMSVTVDGQTVSIARDGDSLTLTVPGQPVITVGPDSIEGMLAQMTGGGTNIPAEVVPIIKREFVQLINIGVTTVEVDGKWYVSPLRSGTGVLVSLLKGLEPADIDYFLSMAQGG